MPLKMSLIVMTFGKKGSERLIARNLIVLSRTKDMTYDPQDVCKHCCSERLMYCSQSY